MDKKILKQLKSDYEEREIKPSVNLWDQIDAALEKESATPQKSSFANNWWKYAAVVLLIISLGTFMYYHDGFNTEKTDYIVKQNLKEEVLEKENYSEMIPKEEKTEEEISLEIIKETDKLLKKNDDKDLVPQKEVIQPQFSEHTESIIVTNQAETSIFHQEQTENNITPEISDTKKISYVTANDLLLGNELDKSREKANADTRKFGVIHRDKVFPKFNNVVVLGATVYIDPR
ncbi:hypothetical protein [Chryseobacterium aquaticum]|uniref:Uncharacterized protein n=1 Tax=Chryseobacterium aquaticum subsp. greenlandense TaxID=345663 RepID=A0A101CG00_9FLAO|nr:hypothetical protein [Chryseobacterium aquaticum]KUJ55489.1 hypothetical protein AR686_11790 [Chryseobacterium aquaticum subsp. greenlandense]